jgi:hypothetical protein
VDQVQWELDVCTTLGTALIATRGHSDPEVGKVHSRARLLIERLAIPRPSFRLSSTCGPSARPRLSWQRAPIS